MSGVFSLPRVKKETGDKLKPMDSGLGYESDNYNIVLFNPKVRDSDSFDLSYD